MRKRPRKPMGLQPAGCSIAFKGDKITTRKNQSISKITECYYAKQLKYRPRMTATCFKLAQKKPKNALSGTEHL